MRRRSQSGHQAEIKERLRFETLVGDLCAQFVNVSPSDLDSKIEHAQRLICESLRINHSSVWQVSDDDPDQLVMTHVYRDSKLKPLPTRPLLKQHFPWSQNRIRNKEIICIPNTARVPQEATVDRESWLQYGVRSTLAFPLSVGGGSVIGFLAFDSTKEREWQPALQRRLQMLAHVFAQALDRKTSEQKMMTAQEALRASEERLRLAQQAARIGTFEWNIQTGANTWTPELESMYGLPLGGFGGTQTAFENLVHPDDRARVIELDNWALKTGQPTTGEWRVVWADGSVHWIAGRWQVFMDESGEPSRMVGINIDITDRKITEQELGKANERLQLAMEAGSVGGWDYDYITGKDMWFGKAHEQLGMTPEETPGSRKEFWDRVHEDDRERVGHALQVAKEKREDFGEDVRVVWRDGTTRWLRSRGRFHYAANGQAERSVGISLDITERKMAEDKLREYERAVENAEEMIAVVDREYRYLIANRQFLKLRNMTREQVVGRFVREVLEKGVFDAVVKPKLDECFQGRVVRYEMKYNYAGLGERDVLVSYFPIENANGINRVACILQDITDGKRAEEALSGMTRKLIAAQEQERARIGRELHDDINQRLAMLGVELEQLQENPSEVQSRVQELRKQTTELSNDVQALSHDLHSSKLEYLGVVAGMKSWCKEFAKRQRIEIDCKTAVSSPLPPEIGLSLFRVLQEALNNAIKHSGVKRIEVQLREDSDEIHLVVSDFGRGFDVEAASQGNGLGLTSMRERVRLVNGKISIESKPMGGTTIHVRVPLDIRQKIRREAV